MGPGGLTETMIAHFAGYLRVPEDFVRVRWLPQEGPPPAPTRDWSPDSRPTQDSNFSPDEISSQGSAASYVAPEPAHIKAAHLHLFVHAAPHIASARLAPDLPAPPQPAQLSEPAAYAAITTYSASSSEPPAPHQQLFSALQVNDLVNDNVYTVDASAPQPHIDTLAESATLDHLITVAQAQAPRDLSPGTTDDSTLVKGIAAHDAAESDGAATPTATPLGDYENGQLLPTTAPFNPPVPTLTDVSPDSSHNGMLHPGLDAQTGGNVSVNAASVLDADLPRVGFVVMGNAYTTNAIYQINELYSRVSVNADAATGSQHISTGDNTTNNLADFTQSTLNGPSGGAPLSLGANVHVDHVDGNFYDVNGILQTNMLSNNNTIVQSVTSSFDEVASGGDKQINELPLNILNNYYDVVIIQGDFHQANVISQTNVLVNEDTILSYSARADGGSQSITVGHNSLSNAAAIDGYGNTAFQPISSSLSQALASLESGKVDPALASQLDSNGSPTLHVLDITGNFYDINYISQTNIMANADAVVQNLPGVSSNLAPTGAHTTSTETVSSGGNSLANIAQIVVAGTSSDFQFLGGSHYDDAILVQANLVSDKEHVTIGDTQTLASEVIAFTGGSESEGAIAPPVGGHAANDSAHHQDLFHGVMS